MLLASSELKECTDCTACPSARQAVRQGALQDLNHHEMWISEAQAKQYHGG